MDLTLTSSEAVALEMALRVRIESLHQRREALVTPRPGLDEELVDEIGLLNCTLNNLHHARGF